MDQRKIAIIAGTSEGKAISERLKRQYCCHVFCATSLGADMIDHETCIIHTGRLNEDGFYHNFKEMEAVVDASHPFAQEVTKTVKAACGRLRIPYIRYLRQTGLYSYHNLIWVDNKEEACKRLNQIDGTIGFTTGINTLPFYSMHVTAFHTRAIARIMKLSPEIPCRQVAARPPFTIEDNLDFIKSYHLDVLLSKDSGKYGGIPEKIEACKQADIPMILIRAPRESGLICRTFQEIDDNLKKLELK